MKRILLVIAAILALPFASFAGSIDGSLSDWGVTPGSNWTNNVGAWQVTNPAPGGDGYVGPGYGGQPFDVNAVYARMDATYLYYAVVTGFASTGETYNGTKYYPGDVLIDFKPFYTPGSSTTPTGTIDYAVETTTYSSSTYPRGGASSQNQGAGSIYSNVTPGLANDQWNGVYYPVEIARSGSNELATATLLGQTSFVYNDTYYGNNYWVMEGQVPLSYFGNISGKQGYLWWTMQCANNYGQLCFQVPTGNVPEPGTIMLTGTGLLLGFGYWQRKRMK